MERLEHTLAPSTFISIKCQRKKLRNQKQNKKNTPFIDLHPHNDLFTPECNIHIKTGGRIKDFVHQEYQVRLGTRAVQTTPESFSVITVHTVITHSEASTWCGRDETDTQHLLFIIKTWLYTERVYRSYKDHQNHRTFNCTHRFNSVRENVQCVCVCVVARNVINSLYKISHQRCFKPDKTSQSNVCVCVCVYEKTSL